MPGVVYHGRISAAGIWIAHFNNEDTFMPKEPMIISNRETLGGYLKDKRESLLVPIQDIAQAVGGPKVLIEALEENDLDAFTLRAQAQALVKKYAAYLKMNEADALRLFDIQWQRYSEQRGFPKLSSFDEAEPKPLKFSVPKKFSANKTFATIKWIKLPDLWHLPKIPTFKSMPKFRLPILAAIILVALFLLIDLPFSKQKPQPPPDPRFSESYRKEPVAVVPAPPPLASEEKTVPLPPPPSANEEKAGATAQEAGKPKEDIPPIPETRHERRSTEMQTGQVIGNSDTKRYHLPGMKFYNKIKAYHRVSFQSEKEAIKAGYRKARE